MLRTPYGRCSIRWYFRLVYCCNKNTRTATRSIAWVGAVSCCRRKLKALMCPTPVSYTHLDVYKRQYHRCSQTPSGSRSSCCCMSQMCSSGPHTPEPSTRSQLAKLCPWVLWTCSYGTPQCKPSLECCMPSGNCLWRNRSRGCSAVTKSHKVTAMGREGSW